MTIPGTGLMVMSALIWMVPIFLFWLLIGLFEVKAQVQIEET